MLTDHQRSLILYYYAICTETMLLQQSYDTSSYEIKKNSTVITVVENDIFYWLSSWIFFSGVQSKLFQGAP